MSDPSPTVLYPLDPAIARDGDGAMKRLYRWTLALAEAPSAPFALGVIAFAERSFIPLPPDVILVPMSLARPKRAWIYALICTAGSVAGALLGYAIGSLLYNTLGQWLIHLYGYGSRIDALKAFFAHWGWAFILVKGFTPIPFKLVTIFSGLVGYNLPLFILLCALTRGARFFVLAILLNLFGESMKRLLERFFGVFMLSLVLVVLAGFYVAAKVI